MSTANILDVMQHNLWPIAKNIVEHDTVQTIFKDSAGKWKIKTFYNRHLHPAVEKLAELWYTFNIAKCHAGESKPWLTLWQGAVTTLNQNAMGPSTPLGTYGFTNVTITSSLPKFPELYKDSLADPKRYQYHPFSNIMWLGLQPTIIPDQYLDPCRSTYDGCNVCEFEGNVNTTYLNGGLFNMAIYDSRIPIEQYLVTTYYKFGDKGSSGPMFMQDANKPLIMNFQQHHIRGDPVLSNLTIESISEAKRGKLMLPQDFLLETFVRPGQDLGMNDISVNLAKESAWHWILAPYEFLQIKNEPHRVEDLPKYFYDEIPETIIEVDAPGKIIEEHLMDFPNGMEVLTGGIYSEGKKNRLFLTFQRFQEYADSQDNSSMNYVWTNCLSAIMKMKKKNIMNSMEVIQKHVTTDGKNYKYGWKFSKHKSLDLNLDECTEKYYCDLRNQTSPCFPKDWHGAKNLLIWIGIGLGVCCCLCLTIVLCKKCCCGKNSVVAPG